MDNTTKKKQVNRPLAASAVVLVGTGLIVAGQPAQAAAPVEAAPGAAVVKAPVKQFVRTTSRSPLIVYRSGMVSGSASISAAPKVSPAKKKVKKKHRSRRS